MVGAGWSYICARNIYPIGAVPSIDRQPAMACSMGKSRSLSLLKIWRFASSPRICSTRDT
jgi:hypothetical protein